MVGPEEIAHQTAGTGPDPWQARDRQGRPFDPAVHLADEQGVPILTSNGRLRKDPRKHPNHQGPSKGPDHSQDTQDQDMQEQEQEQETRDGPLFSDVSGVHALPGAEAPGQDSGQESGQGQEQGPEMDAQAVGATLSRNLTTLAQAILGQEWQPVQIPGTELDEQSLLDQGFSSLIAELEGKGDLPPWLKSLMPYLTFLGAVGMYCGPRLINPEIRATTANNLANLFRQQGASGDASHSDSRTDGSGEKHPGSPVDALSQP